MKETVIQIFVEMVGVSEKTSEFWISGDRDKGVSVTQIQPWEVGIAGAILHDRIVGAEKDNSIMSGFLDGSGYLVGRVRGEGVLVPLAHGLRTQADSGCELRASSTKMGAEHAVLRMRRGWIEVRPNLTEKLRHARNMHSGGFYEKLGLHLCQRQETEEVSSNG